MNKRFIGFKNMTKYFDEIFILGETLFKSIIKLYNKDINNSKLAFSRHKTLSTLRFNYYPNQSKPVEISKQDVFKSLFFKAKLSISFLSLSTIATL